MKWISVALIMSLALVCGCQRKLSAKDAVAELKARITEDSLYSWTTIDRLEFNAGRTTDQYIDVQISEIHRGDDGADPNTHPTVDFWRVDRRTGEWEVEWPAPGEGRISYDLFRSITKDKLNHRTAAERGDYRAVELFDPTDKSPVSVIVLYKGQQVYEYWPRYVDAAEDIGIDLAYGELSDRSSKPQPKPMDDILGNGLSDLVIIERPMGYNHQGAIKKFLTIVSLDGNTTRSVDPIPWWGEIVYFHDFDGDGCMEIVNTDWEQGFRKFDASGVPLHTCVWQYDSKAGRYRETGTEDPDAPDTWPAYRDKEPDATPPSKP